MSSSVKLSCVPAELSITLGNICAHLQNGKQLAQVQEGKQGEGDSLEFRRFRFRDNLACLFTRGDNEMAAVVQSALEKNLIKGNDHLLQAYQDIATYPSARTTFYEQFFSLHLFRKDHEQNLKWLPLIYLKLRQTTNSFEPIMASMQPCLKQLRNKARTGPNPANGDENPNLYFVSLEGERVYGHSQWLSQSKVIRDAAPQPAGNIAPWEFPQGTKPTSRILHLFLDIVYATAELKDQNSEDLEAIYNLADSLKCKELRDAAFKHMQNALRKEMERRYSPRSSGR
jgi:hypothetical protein